MIDELVAFLRARYDDEERIAQAASGVCGCHPGATRWLFADDEHEGRIVTVDDPHPGIRRQLGRRWNRDYNDTFAARHIAYWDPARVLADIASKRRIVDECAYWYERVTAEEARPMPCVADRFEVAMAVLRLLAVPYAGHPDYQAEWRP